MGNSKVSKDFSSGKFTDQELGTKATEVCQNMKDNPAFLNPTPSLEAVTSLTGSYINALAKAANGTKADTAIKCSLRAELETALKQEADYVQAASNGDEAIILSSGFDVNRHASTVGALAKPANFKVQPGTNRGELICSCDAVPGAYVYELDFTEAPATATSVWQKVVNSKRKVTIKVESGKQYVVRMVAIGSDTTRNWSDDLTSFVL